MMRDFHDDPLQTDARLEGQLAPLSDQRMHFPKRLFDIAIAVSLLPLLLVSAVMLLFLNPNFNAGSLILRQRRMGFMGRPFVAYKFRSMHPVMTRERGAFDGLEEDRISPLGALIRKCRIDELPQIINVLRNEMSLIGPRPDLFEHACAYQQQVPGYADRHRVKPGISGYAQTEVGYVDGLDGIKRKVAADHYYIAHATLWFDLWITWRTICVIAGLKGR